MSTNRKIFARLLTATFSAMVFVAVYLISYQPSIAEKIVYTGKENHVVDLESAKRWTSNFQETSKPGDVLAGYMGRNIFENILSQNECVGIRIYNAKLENGRMTFVIVGVDGSGNDIVGGVVGEEIYNCPPWCPPATLDLLNKKEVIASAK